VLAGPRLLAHRTFGIPADRMTTRHLRLTRSARALLRRTRHVRVDVRVQTRGRDGVLRGATERLTLALASKSR
jgi:hypothetical protein